MTPVEEQDEWLVTLSDRTVLDLLGPADGAAYEVIARSMLEDKRDQGLDPATAVLRRVVEKWNAKRRKP